MAASRDTFAVVLRQAIADIAARGLDQPGRLAFWTTKLRRSAEGTMQPLWRVEVRMRRALGAIYRRLVDRGQVARWHRGLSLYTIRRLTPHMRAELDRKILASAELIKLNREAAIQRTLQRFSGWATSVPSGGTRAADRGAEAEAMRKSLASLPFQERRVVIDQGHKLSTSISAVVAKHGGAIAAVWRSNWRQANYDYREDHRDRDEEVYLLRGSWAVDRGYARPGKAGWSDEITQPGEEVYCRCYWTYIYSLASLPPDMLTAKGRDELERTRKT